jgi:hypothetical protein
MMIVIEYLTVYNRRSSVTLRIYLLEQASERLRILSCLVVISWMIQRFHLLLNSRKTTKPHRWK